MAAICVNRRESCHHLLLWCPTVYNIWTMIYGLLGIGWVVTASVREGIWLWDDISTNRSYIELTVFWVIWKERKRRAFDGVGSDIRKNCDR